ncbi:MAG TPA: PilZ domain-containing protein [Xanthobacteraceae bacterium]|nr:PilZ domain-containing protein [Xanthobacteraceae bacterium]
MSRERRKNFRVEWNSPATLYDADGSSGRPCIVSNLSNGGAKIAGVVPDTIPDEFILRITPHSRPRRCQVLWRSKDSLGVEFAPVTDTRAEPAPSGQEVVA